MCTQAELDDYCRRTCTELQGMRDEHDKGKKRRKQHLEVKNHLKHDSKPAPTRRRGIGAIRLTRRQRNLEIIEQYEERATHLPELDEIPFVAPDTENEEVLGEIKDVLQLHPTATFDEVMDELKRMAGYQPIEEEDEIRIFALEQAGNVVLDTDDIVDTYGDTLHLTDERVDELVLR